MTKYPFALLIPQHEIEKILKEHLLSTRVYLSRNQTVVGMRQNDRGGVQVSFEDGNIVNAQYVIGADGSRSTVCHSVFRPLQKLIGFRSAASWASNS